MLLDLIVALLIMLCGVAVYYALLGLILLYQKISAGNVPPQPQVPPPQKAEPAEKEKTRPTQSIRRKGKPRQEKITGQGDPLRHEQMQRKEEFLRTMQQRDEELLRELKRRREESQPTQQTEE